MNRELKFRVWDGMEMFLSPSEIEFLGSWFDAHAPGALYHGGNIFMQYTGLKDKNGKEIYEGDIIEVERKDDTIIVECIFGTIERQMATGFLVDITGFYFEREDGCQTFPIKRNYRGSHDLEVFSVIGNIYENPELLTSK